MEDVHEPPSVGRDVGLVDGEVEVGQHLHGLEQDASLPGAVDLHHGSAPRIISHRRREQEGTRQEAGDTGETARRLAHLHERGRGADSIVDDHPRRVHPDHQLLVLVEPLHLPPSS